MRLIGQKYQTGWLLFVGTALSLPLLGLLFCIIYSIIYNFTEANSTACKVFNFLPSISAASGSREPKISVWKWSIVMHTPLRYVICLFYILLYNAVAKGLWKSKCYPFTIAAAIVNIAEVTALCTLAVYSSYENFEVHEESFIVFLTASIIYMIIHTKAQSSLLDNVALTYPQRKVYSSSLMRKKSSMLVNISSLMLAGYMYYRHNKYCEPGVYSMFAFFEYLVVLSNMAYHSTAIQDFSVDPPVESVEESSWYSPSQYTV